MASQPAAPYTCAHKNLTYLCSPHFGFTGYKPSSTPDLKDAARWDEGNLPAERPKVTEAALPSRHSWAFPAPLLLPGAALEDVEDYRPQSLNDWYHEKHRNKVNARRRTLYVCAAPTISKELNKTHRVSDWTVPKLETGAHETPADKPEIKDIGQYIAAFYHGLPVKVLDAGLKFVPWNDQNTKVKAPNATTTYVGLATSKQCFRIRARAVNDSVFPWQLNLNDLLDVVISILPKDAYSLIMMADHDLYEHDEDDFCCGRAYGGSRVAVVSTARYNPVLDKSDGLDHQHAWPGSHCLNFVLSQCETAGCGHVERPKKKVKRAKRSAETTCDLLKLQPAESPLHQAVTAHDATASADRSAYELWFARVCKTTSHELGHCFGMDHCVYYACIMQSTSCCAEDAEQPPFLCPVDQRKVLAATGSNLKETYEALRTFCVGRKEGRMWASFAAWLSARLQEIQDSSSSVESQPGDRTQPIFLE